MERCVPARGGIGPGAIFFRHHVDARGYRTWSHIFSASCRCSLTPPHRPFRDGTLRAGSGGIGLAAIIFSTAVECFEIGSVNPPPSSFLSMERSVRRGGV